MLGIRCPLHFFVEVKMLIVSYQKMINSTQINSFLMELVNGVVIAFVVNLSII